MSFSIEEARQFLFRPGFHLSDVDPASTPGVSSEAELAADFAQHDREISDLQENLWANARSGVDGTGSVLLVLQGMDTSGKGGLIKRLARVMHPMGLSFHAFGKPTPEEAAHDFLWRVRPKLPEPGEIAVFDRSHYEDVLVQKIEGYAEPAEIERRYGAIVDFENEVAARGTRIIKVMLHISRGFQYANLVERLTDEKKMWKFDRADLVARSKWEKYLAAYQTAFERTSTAQAPWYVVPGDNKEYARMVVKHLLVEQLRELQQPWPRPVDDLETARRHLDAS
ncbi:PPK2 family polyphosphate kinase [Corynebacterium guangdongense]|uniref:PPK2 family polyphosphate:nucleotide phosphotransferase n=1 Tax=Corynebacterium guangdongense TaxID=1783348 RepID=A0ABU1ZWY8_9CORY|nr:PPK2 family polyphosphate kinase [Corynebacterium guangdongense]MDR7329426.1 PPK2 family polyphosphate:nucleotide phosphotransferase [Corynebacterium guangdongense]